VDRTTLIRDIGDFIMRTIALLLALAAPTMAKANEPWFVINQDTDQCVVSTSVLANHPETPTTPEAMARILRARGARVEEEVFRDPFGGKILSVMQTIFDHGVKVGGVGWYTSMQQCTYIQCVAKDRPDLPGNDPRRPPHHDCSPPPH
jgi:hypothetical protein